MGGLHGMVARVICTAAIVTLSALCSTILVTTYDSQRERLETRMGHATDAAVRLLTNASAFRAENGRFPETHGELMHGARARQAPEVEVLRFDGTTDRFCVVAALLGRLRGTHADDLIVTGLVRTAAGATPLIAEGELPCDDVVADAAPVAGSP
jgi:hypothetical protein